MLKNTLLALLLIVAFWYVASNYQEITHLAPQALNIKSLSVAQVSTSQKMAVARLDQNSAAQYDSISEYQQWSPSACSAAALASAMNRYGHDYRVHDVLLVMIQQGDISGLGLLAHEKLVPAAQHFGFHAALNEADTLDNVIQVANSGTPVIVNWPPGRFFGGHFVVVTGGNKNTVFLADSSSYNYPSLSRSRFLSFWGEPGFSAAISPQ